MFVLFTLRLHLLVTWFPFFSPFRLALLCFSALPRVVTGVWHRLQGEGNSDRGGGGAQEGQVAGAG